MGILSWLDPDEVPEEDTPIPMRLASPEFLSGFVEIAEIYEKREKAARELVVPIADNISRKTFFNYKELDQLLDRIRDAMTRADNYRDIAKEIRGWIYNYEYHGVRPPYMPEPPPELPKPYQGGE